MPEREANPGVASEPKDLIWQGSKPFVLRISKVLESHLVNGFALRVPRRRLSCRSGERGDNPRELSENAVCCVLADLSLLESK